MEKMTCMETGTKEPRSPEGCCGVFETRDAHPVVVSDGRECVLPGPIWVGWLGWKGREVCWLPAEKVFPPCPVILPRDQAGFSASDERVSILFMHRLRGQIVSLFGHIAIIVRGRVWNFSAILEENECPRADEFFWRPCLSPFVPEGGTDLPVSLHRAHPIGSLWGIRGGQREAAGSPERFANDTSANKSGPRADRYGRRFMRSMDVLEIAGLGSEAIAALEDALTQLLGRVNEAAPRSRRGESPYFSPWKMNCAGFVREAFRLAGLAHFHSHLPRDLFVEIGWHFTRQARQPDSPIRVERRRLLQVAAPGIRPSSSAVPLMNPASWWRVLRMG
ncbi:MAG TPA: hypothetical protein PK297_05830 [Spirochaetota bacterium]|nr:hypothetical protein [Spirochaetota bacterium]